MRIVEKLIVLSPPLLSGFPISKWNPDSNGGDERVAGAQGQFADFMNCVMSFFSFLCDGTSI
jgi:hypothetical protein